MRVIAAGMHRSGSTWLYNVLRLIFEQQGLAVYGCFFNDYDPEQAHDADVEVIKLHEFKQIAVNHANHIFMTRRDLRDIAASAVRMKLIKPQVDEVFDYIHRCLLKEHDGWVPHLDMVVPYEVLKKNKVAMIRKIARTLREPVDPKKVHVAVEALRPEEPFNPTTQLHANHITDGRAGGYRRTLPEKLIKQIEKRYAGWFKQYGYKL